MTKRILSSERLDKIVEIVKKKGAVTVKELTEIFSVTERTINRDLKFMDRENFLKKVHGGAVLPKEFIPDLMFEDNIKAQIQEKKIIAKKALEFIYEDDSLILDASTTSIILAREIVKKNINNLTIISNSTYTIDALKKLPNSNIICTGGEYIVKNGSLVGIYSESMLSRIRAKKLFFSVAGISLSDGLTDSVTSEKNIKNIMMEVSGEINLLVISNKINKVAVHRVAPISSIDRLIIDSGASESFINGVKDLGVDIIVTNKDQEL